MYRSSSDYRFAGVERSPLHRPHFRDPSNRLSYFTSPPRRGSINELIDKFEVPKIDTQAQLQYRYLRQMSGSSDAVYYDSVFYDTTDQGVVVVDEMTREDETVRRSMAMRALLPIWLLIRPVLEAITIAPLPLFFSFTGTGIFALLVTFIMPRSFSQMLLYPGFRLICGTLYPAYASYKAVRTKNVKEYVSILRTCPTSVYFPRPCC